jgi:hypothetical protein
MAGTVQLYDGKLMICLRYVSGVTIGQCQISVTGETKLYQLIRRRAEVIGYPAQHPA